MDIFKFRDKIIDDYRSFTRSFTRIRADDLQAFLDHAYERQHFWPAPLIQMNPRFVRGRTINEMVANELLHPECANVFRVGKRDGNPGKTLVLHKHQDEAIEIANRNASYVLTTGTGSGKSLSYFVPIVDHVLEQKESSPAPGIRAIVIYPMNALANSQLDELNKFLKEGYPDGEEPVSFGRYTGQESQDEREAMAANPPDILLTNFMMLELIMTRQNDTDKAIVRHAKGLQFLVLDELHTYRGRQGADVALLVRRVREALNPDLLCIGTSATMASEGTLEDRNRTVAQVASKLFGRSVRPGHVITETLQRITEGAPEQPQSVLQAAIAQAVPTAAERDALRRHPVAIWVETHLGLNRVGERWERAQPRSLDQAAEMLSEASGGDVDACQRYLREFLLLCQRKDLFAFRLHQFVSGAGNLYTTLEAPGERYIDLSGQQVQPGQRSKRLFNVAFCRECGQEYYPVWAQHEHKALRQFEPRELNERTRDEDDEFGLFMPDPRGKWDDEDIDNYPELWIDYARDEPRLKPHFRKYRPQAVQVDTDGAVGDNGLWGWFLPGNMRFCLQCGVSYHAHSKESSRLSSLSSEGRSSATTTLTLSALRHMLLEESELPPAARKLLCFTDNRQDASLQAGHFNDSIQILLLRSAVLTAARQMAQREERLSDRNLTQQVFQALGFDRNDPDIRREYMSNPDAMGPARRRAEDAMRDVLGYRLYFDLRRGWRFTNPNLEQLELLRIEYEGLSDTAREASLWHESHPLLRNAKPEVRAGILKQLLDLMRQSLCIKTRYLDRVALEQIQQASHNYLREPWGFTEDERPEQACFLVPGPKGKQNDWQIIPLSSRSRFGKELRKQSTWGGAPADFPEKFNEAVFEQILADLLRALERFGLIEAAALERGRKGYQIIADTLEWHVATDDEQTGQPSADKVANYFRNLYENIATYLGRGEAQLFRLEAREHTAQVDQEDRKVREERFRDAELPVLFCSPTMELGVDIAELNTVYMRNVPPTPANYAQRSGRAGRSGQPALVLTYCAARSPHDQYFFSDPVRMVQGQVRAPTLDLTNEELIRSHLHAVWLSETGQQLANSVADVLDMEQGDKLPLRTELKAMLDAEQARLRSSRRAIAIMGMLADELTPENAPWHHEGWLDQTIRSAFRAFDQALDRWRNLYLSTTRQMNQAHQIQLNAAASDAERQEAARRYNEARTQQNLLLQSRPTLNSDFYTYRYLASQGFLPGYNFPRLPLMAFIPARREKVGRDSFLARPRFLAISEFGPLSVIYHEGSQYRVRRVIIGVREEDGADSSIGLPTRSVRLCPVCGYGHFEAHRDDERCNACGAPLEGGMSLQTLYRVENVSARRATRITSDEEERLRQGYEMQTTLQYATDNGRQQVIKSEFRSDDTPILEIHYAPAATVWRINLGWRRRKEKSIYGYNIDVTTGFWAKDAQAPEDEDQAAEKSVSQVQRIVPYVEDRRNVLIVHPADLLDEETIITLQYALKRGIETVFQLEESELMAEPLPTREQRNAILFYESAEGGAGVLTRLANDPSAMQRVAWAALEVMHYKGDRSNCTHASLEDTEPDCEKACYRCLLSYYNQPDHGEIDRKNEALLDLLCQLTQAQFQRGTLGRDAEAHIEELERVSGSSLEQAWIDHLKRHGYRLPDKAQFTLEAFHTRPDFGYLDAQALIYIDGPHHESQHQQAIDDQLTARLEDAGFLVIRFPKEQSAWPAIFARHPDIFGKEQTA